MTATGERRRPAVAVAVALSAAAGALIAGGLAAAASQVGIDDSVATLIALTMAVAASGVGAGWLVHRRGEPGLGARLQLLGVLTTAGVTRHLDLGRVGLIVAGACWLAAPAAGLAVAATVSSERWRRRRPAAVLVAVAVLALAAALAGGGAGPGSWTFTTVGADVPVAARALAVVQGLTMAAAALALCGRPRRRTAGAPGRGGGPEGVVWASVGVTVAATVAHLLPVRWLFDPEGYRAWAETLTLKVPLVATVAVLGAVAYDRAVRPWLLPKADRVAIDLARLPALATGLARWTADPTVELAFPAPDGGWVDGSGRPLPEAAGPRSDRLVVVLTSGGAPVARIEHDADLAAQPGLIDYDVRLVSAVLAAERGAAVAAARLAEARRANTLLLRADDNARQELRARLAAGPVATLERLAAGVENGAEVGMEDGAAAEAGIDLAATADGIRRVAAEVRELSHGLYPPELATGGLAAALPLAAGVPGRRLPPAVEVTAYLIAAGRPDVVLDDRGTWLGLRVGGGADLPVERIEALGGSVRPIAGPDAGGGSSEQASNDAVAVELPTAWE